VSSLPEHSFKNRVQFVALRKCNSMLKIVKQFYAAKYFSTDPTECSRKKQSNPCANSEGLPTEANEGNGAL
jgi:hypothetical protein